MTDLADGVVYSRSGLTHQAGLLEKPVSSPAAESPRPARHHRRYHRSGRAHFAKVLPGHIQVVRDLLFDSLSAHDVHTLGDIMSRTRDHMRTLPPRSAKPRTRHPGT